MPGLLKKILKALFRQTDNGFSADESAMLAELQQTAEIIGRHFQYFNELSLAEKKRFLYRVYHFRDGKDFHFVGLKPEVDIPVLVSAAAVQITFGLRKYRMPYFRHIYVMADSYTFGKSREPWAGHVNRSGIYISWKHFLHGYAVQNDRYNLGLHEMAHAMEYANFLDRFGADRHFRDQFLIYKKKADGLQFHDESKPSDLFSTQARTDFHECWAESVELFFENPAELQQLYPELYEAVKVLLNQDPLRGIKILQEDIGGPGA